MGNAIPYADLYENWLSLDCEDVVFDKLPVKKTNYVIKSTDTIDRIKEDFLNDPGETLFYPVIYYSAEGSFVHHAACLRRKGIVEYIDSMAIADGQDQIEMEEKLKQAAKAVGLAYKGADVMYGGMVADERYGVAYKRLPPQSAENVFLGTLYRGYFKEHQDLLAYAKSLERYSEGDCVLWAHLIARSMVKNSLSSAEWSEKFISATEKDDKSRGLFHKNDVELAVGLFASMYITRHLIKQLQRCSKLKLRKI